MDLFIRITLSYYQFASATESFANVCEKLVIYEHNHDEDNIHIHMYMKGCTVSTDTLKNYVRKICKTPKGNKFWSFKTAKDDKCITYMTKGVLEPVYVKEYSIDELDVFKSQWVDKQKKKLTIFTVKESHKESKLRQSDMINEIIKRIKQSDDYTHEHILKLIRQVVIIEQSTIIGRYKVRDYFDTIRAKLLTSTTWVMEMKNFMRLE